MAYADKVVVLDDKGRVKAQGAPEEVAVALGISIPKREPVEPQAKYESEAAIDDVVAVPGTSDPVDTEFTDPLRRLGDPGTFRHYGKAAGWSTLAFVLCSLSIYAFCGSFPRE